MPTLVAAQAFLVEQERGDLAALLDGGHYAVVFDAGEMPPTLTLELRLCPVCAAAAVGLVPVEHELLIDALGQTDPDVAKFGPSADRLVIRPDESVTAPPDVQLLAELIVQRALLIDVATQRVLLAQREEQYSARRRRIADALRERGLPDPVPFESLWEWQRHWSAELPSHQKRRTFASMLFRDTIAAVLAPRTPAAGSRTPARWRKVQRAIARARAQLALAGSEPQSALVGKLCLDALTALAHATYDPRLHVTGDRDLPSGRDARRMLDAVIRATIPRTANDALKRHAKAALALASSLAREGTPDVWSAALCLEATESTATIIAILSGRTTINVNASE